MEKENILKVVRGMSSMDIVIACFYNVGGDDVCDSQAKCGDREACLNKNKDNLFEFHVTLNNEEGNPANLAIYFDKNNVARISETPFQGTIPDKIAGYSAFGFIGTWDDVAGKVYELKMIIHHQPSSGSRSFTAW